MREPEATVKAKDYVPLLGLVMAAIIGVSLLCGVAVIGISDINNAVPIGTQTEGLVDFVISNMNTMIVETVQAFSQPESVSAISPTNTGTLFLTGTLVASNTPTGTFVGSTRTSTSPPNRPARTKTPTPRPTATYTLRPPSSTPRPPSTYTPTPTNTYTLVPTIPTDTPDPTSTDTPVSPTVITDTPVTPYP